MPGVAKEACAVLGLKQHWKVFTNLYEVQPNCLPFIVGAVQGSTQFLNQHHAESLHGGAPRAVFAAGIQFVDLIKWHNAGGPLRPGRMAGPDATAVAEARLLHVVGAPSEQTVIASELTPEKVLSRSASTLASTYLWRQWALASQAIDMNVIGTGQYFCKRWNRMRLLSLRVQVDERNVTLTFTPEPEDILRASKSFCEAHEISMEQCQRLYDLAKRTASGQRLEAYSFFNVCMQDSMTFAGSTVSGQTRRCDDDALTKGLVHRIDHLTFLPGDI